MEKILIPKKHLFVEKSSPAEIDIKELSLLLKEKLIEEARTRKYASIKKVLLCLTVIGSIPVVLMAPKSGIIIKPLINKLTDQEKEDWRKYNLSYLNRSLNLLYKQKIVEIKEVGQQAMLVITENGRRRILKYALEELDIPKPKIWDKKWRLIIFDVPETMVYHRNNFRRFVKQLGLLRIQKSVYLYPYPCQKQIEFLREYLGVGNFIIYAVADYLENDEPYKKYFGL